MTAATLIAVDFKARQKLYTEQLAGPDKAVQGVNLSRNKQLINDLKGLLDDNIEHLNLEPAILVIPHPEKDLYIKMDGNDIGQEDIKALSGIVSKMRARHVQKP